MIPALIGRLALSATARRVLAGLAVAVAAVLYVSGLRRAGERAGRAAERMQQQERTNDVQRRMLDAAADRPRDRSELAERMRNGRF